MKPEIIVTTRDFERLIALIDSLPPSLGCEELLGELGRAELVDGDEVPPVVVTMNSTVRFTLGDGEEFCMTLVYPREAGDQTISVLSPVGSALLGLAVGSSIEWSGPNGAPLLVKVLDIVYQPERDGVATAT